MRTAENSTDTYRYGFYGMEKDDEVKGKGNSYTTQFRQYDSRVGRWLSVDPKISKYPDQSAFVSFNNNPVFFNDPLGDDPPKKLGAGQRFKNWRNGESYKNRVNKFARKNKIDESQINFQNEMATVTIKESLVKNVEGEAENITITYNLYERYRVFEGNGDNDRTVQHLWHNHDVLGEVDLMDPNWHAGLNKKQPSSEGSSFSNPMFGYIYSSSYAGFFDPFYDVAHVGISNGLKGVGMNETTANNTANGIIMVGSLATARYSSNSYGWGYKIGKNTEILYKNPNVGGRTIYSYSTSSKIRRVDYHEININGNKVKKLHFHSADRVNYSSNRQFQKEASLHKNILTGQPYE